MHRYLALLRENPEFTKIWWAQVISLTGDWFNTVVLSALVSQYSNGSGLAISIFLMARFLPPLLVSPFAGVIVDRFNRKNILIWSNILRAFIVPLFLLADSPDQLWLIYVVTIVQFVLSAIFEPGQSAILPALVKEEQLVTANTLINITWSVMLAFGAVLGGAFAFIFGTEAALLMDAVTFAVAAGFIYAIRYDKDRVVTISSVTTDSEDNPDDLSFREGIRYVLRTPSIAAALFVKFGISIGNVDTIMTILATQVFILGASGELSLGILYSVFGIGALIGPILANRFHDGSVQQMRRLITLGFVSIVFGWIFLGASVTLFIACIASFVRAAGGSVNWTYSSIIIQKTAPNEKLGRMFSLDFAGFQFSTVVSTLVHGALIEVVGAEHVHTIALATGVVSLIPLLIWLWILPRIEKQESRIQNNIVASVIGD